MRLVARDNSTAERVGRWFSEEELSLERTPVVDGRHVREVQLENMPDETRHVVLYLNETGARRLAQTTRAHRGRRLAIVVDGRIVAAPTIRNVIAEGVAHVSVGPDGDIERVFDALTRPASRRPRHRNVDTLDGG